jgi:hypothetical protein
MHAHRHRYLILSALLLAFSAVVLVLIQVYPLSWGPPSRFATALLSLSEVAFLAHLALSAAIGVLSFIALVIALKRKSRVAASLSLLVALACLSVAVVPASVRISSLARRASVRNLAEHADPLVGAVSHFALETGHPPSSLQELIPQYLSAIPNTGLRGCPYFAYEALDGEEAGPANVSTDGWELHVHCPTGMINWDMFLFRPNGVYPEHAHGGRVEAIASGWAYVHE